jgi:tyrosine-specific transport protein
MIKSLKKIILPIAVISGTIIGVGLFSLPYIASKTGYVAMLGYFLVLGIISILIHLFFGELSLATPDFKRLPGFAKVHLGEWAKKITMFSTVFGISGAILAYLIVGGEFLSSMFSPNFGGSNYFYSYVYFFLGAALIFFGIKAIAKIEFWSLVLFFLILLAIFVRGNSLVNAANFTAFPFNLKTGFSLSDLFLPYGPILFSLWGASLIPEAEEMLKGNKNLLKRVIVISSVIPIIIYLFFIYLIWGITGPLTTESALTGLKLYLGDGIVNMALFLGFLTTFTSFIALGLTLKKILWYDFGFSKNMAWFLTCFVPLGFFALGFQSFISVIGLVGAIGLGIDGILILLMYRKLLLKRQRTKKSLLVFPLIFVFVFGIIYELIYFFD